MLILCTDGITESMDREGEEYGSKRLVECVRGSIAQSAEGVVNAVAADVSAYSREGTHLDDKVLIAIKVGAGG
jgi:sigma-B regulation protein RsbU (phosphoserine phosphatase)